MLREKRRKVSVSLGNIPKRQDKNPSNLLISQFE